MSQEGRRGEWGFFQYPRLILCILLVLFGPGGGPERGITKRSTRRAGREAEKTRKPQTLKTKISREQRGAPPAILGTKENRPMPTPPPSAIAVANTIDALDNLVSRLRVERDELQTRLSQAEEIKANWEQYLDEVESEQKRATEGD